MIEHRADVSATGCSLLMSNSPNIDTPSEGPSNQFVALRATL